MAAQSKIEDLGKLKYFVRLEKTQYQRFVRKLIYLSHTRPDIVYIISVVS